MKSCQSPRPAPPLPAGFTLVELLVVLLIVGVIAAVSLPVVIPAISHRQVSESARIVQGGLVAARDAALRSNTPHGIRFLPDPTYNGLDPANPTAINRFRSLASNRFIPIEQPPGYSEGKLFLDDASGAYWSSFDNYPYLDGAGGVDTNSLYYQGRVQLLVQARYRTDYDTSTTPPTPFYPLEAPTSWYWNVRRGDKIQVNNTGPFFTVVGPMDIDNPEKFINVDPDRPALRFTAPDGSGNYYPEILFIVNGEDDDKDGYVDNGFDGVDNNLNGLVDEWAEWSENEVFPAGFRGSPPEVVGFPNRGVPYTIVRRPVPSPGARETVLPSNVVVDLTTSLPIPTPDGPLLRPERSRVPVDGSSGVVDILLDPSGAVVPAMQYSSPSSFGMTSSFYHIWLAERSDLAEVQTTGSGATLAAAPLLSTKPFYLPMPLGQNAGATPNAYDALVAANATLPYLKGEMRLLTLFTRTGNLMITDRPLFNVDDVNQPYLAPQRGEQGDAP